jgi:hypothetical protein
VRPRASPVKRGEGAKKVSNLSASNRNRKGQKRKETL